ncbi:MAG: chemotaxis protein CheW [Gemmatimonas sp.]
MTMINLQPRTTTDAVGAATHGLLDEEDERDRVLLVELKLNSPRPDGSGAPSEIDRYLSLALPVSLTREVVRARSVTRVPGAPPAMRGLVNVRGMVVTVLDLAVCLGQRESGRVDIAPRLDADSNAGEPGNTGARHETGTRTQMAGSIVLLEHGGRLVGVTVDHVRDVRPLDDAGLVEDAGAFVQGLASAGGQLVTLLDVPALLAQYLITSGEA